MSDLSTAIVGLCGTLWIYRPSPSSFPCGLLQSNHQHFAEYLQGLPVSVNYIFLSLHLTNCQWQLQEKHEESCWHVYCCVLCVYVQYFYLGFSVLSGIFCLDI
ncbi:hypothetical protein HOLleu_37532 [Holothuria leucospilota]|uniref:Uncharacterized protein n=1 Tax=Holothuria leucospilota TaxID=206669 RepID=A0A9Q0YJK0_HOLLE|nr:hypothetical protein HOLleu_37532 [Holothuria leucospilota]